MSVENLPSRKTKYTIEYIRHPFSPPESPSDVPVVASCAHRLLPYGCITDDYLYERLEDARARELDEYDSDCDSRSSCSSWQGSYRDQREDRKRLSAKFLTEKYCPMVTAAQRNPRVCGILSDNSDNRLLNDPEFEEIPN